ncbi:MAG TPA: hypothetical protein VGE21_16565 [Flavobacteriales bacterium]
MRKRYWILLLLLLLIGAGVFFVPDQLARLVREKSLEAVENACGPHSVIRIAKVDIDLSEGHVTWTGIDIHQAIDSGDTTWARERQLLIRGHVDSIEVRGLSIWQLLTSRALVMRSLSVNGPDLEFLTAAKDTTASAGTTPRKAPIQRIRMDSLRVDSGAIRLRDVRKDKPEIRTRLDLALTGIECRLPRADQALALAFSGVAVRLHRITAALPPLYDATIDELVIAHPDSLVRVRGIMLTPRAGPLGYQKVLRYETDLFHLKMDSLSLRGLDLQALVTQRSLRTTRLCLSGTTLDVHRDKGMPDEPFQVKHMPAGLLRRMPMSLLVDSVLVQRMNVRYFERDTLTPDYGEVAFTDIHAYVTGLNTVDSAANPEMHLHADARVYDKAPVRLDLRTRVQDRTDRFRLHAHIGALPFQVFNRMTDDLVLVRATAGRVHGIDYTLNATDDRAQVRVEIEYEGLDVEVRKRDGTRQENKLLSFVVNQLKRNKNLRSDPNFRAGEAEIERWKDRQIFNYMWRGLKQGVIVTVTPKMLGDVQRITKESVDERVKKERRKAKAADARAKASEP